MINIKGILITQLALIASCCGLLFFISPSQVFPFFAGGVVSFINFFLLAQLWKGILDKKSVATSLVIIVTKYAILGVLLYVFVKKWNLSLIPLVAGLSTLGASILLVVMQYKFAENKVRD
jgi:hypothetical protein